MSWAQPPAAPSAVTPPAAAPVSSADVAPARPVLERLAPVISPAVPEVSGARKQLYWAIKLTRIAVSWGTMAWSLSFLLYFLLLGGMLQPKKLEGTVVMAFLQVTVVPLVSWVKSVITLRVAYQNWDFMILGLGLVTLFVRALVLIPFEKAEDWAKPKEQAPPR